MNSQTNIEGLLGKPLWQMTGEEYCQLTQYAPIDVQAFNKAHDRFLIIDDKVYHIGASLKDLGKKWFAFSLMQDLTPQDLISRI